MRWKWQKLIVLQIQAEYLLGTLLLLTCSSADFDARGCRGSEDATNILEELL